MTTSIKIISKNPEFADCKTRLKKLLTHEDRAFLAKVMLEMTCKAVSEFTSKKLLHLYPRMDGKFIDSLAEKYHIKLMIQASGKLSDKIYSILNIDTLPHYNRLVIGSDIPSISPKEISECINLLNTNDCVFGPSNDGGFYLVGVKGNAHSIFENLNMNTIILNDLMNICRKSNLSYKCIRKLKDIDCEKDLLFI